MSPTQTTLRITEVFHSLQGESRTVGIPTTFIRLTGCPLRCRYCDTAYAFSGGVTRDISSILRSVRGFGGTHVTVTGGEPLAQDGCLELLERLCDADYAVSLETSGAMSIIGIDARVSVVMDLKTPDSGEAHRNLLTNVEHLRSADQVKFVICSRPDYEWSKQKIAEYGLTDRVAEVLVSPSYGELPPKDLAEWVLADDLKVRFQIQLHRLLWGDAQGV